MGGTILKYIKEDKDVREIVFSYGQLSHPHFKEEIVIETRKKETEKVAKTFGMKEITFLALNDRQVEKEANDPKIINKVKSIIKKYNPEKIFTLSSEDTHLDHRAVNKAVLKAIDSISKKYPVFTFQVWGKDIKQGPKMYINISEHFKNKIRMMKLYKSQLHFIYPLTIPIFFKNKINGIKHHCKYAEVFRKIRWKYFQ